MAGSPALPPRSLNDWLLTNEPASRTQARLGRAYLNWRAFSRNPLAMVGLFIVLALVVVAVMDWVVQ